MKPLKPAQMADTLMLRPLERLLYLVYTGSEVTSSRLETYDTLGSPIVKLPRSRLFPGAIPSWNDSLSSVLPPFLAVHAAISCVGAPLRLS